MTYNFDVEVANKYGVDEAIFIHAVFFDDRFGYILDERGDSISNIKTLNDILPFFTNRQLTNIISKLLLKGAILKTFPDPFNVRNQIIESKHGIQAYGVSKNRCGWCGCKTAILHEHHFPIPKSKGGVETISICPNCHTEFHYLNQGRIALTASARSMYG